MTTNLTNESISIIIFVRNEEIHIQRCLDEIKEFTKNIFIVDSSSEDRTRSILKFNKLNYLNYDAASFGEKINWAINNLPIKTEWTMRLDADEILTTPFKEKISSELNLLENNIDGVYINRRHYFMGKWIKHGGMHPKKALRIWRTGKAYCEERILDEQMVCKSGETINIELDIIDNNLNDLSMLIRKHNSLSSFESILNEDMDEIKPRYFGTQTERIRWLKNNIYNKMPLFVGPFAYFIYRYFIRLGFLDGKEGLIWHFQQGLCYRFLIDAKKYEMSVTGTRYEHDVNNIYK